MKKKHRQRTEYGAASRVIMKTRIAILIPAFGICTLVAAEIGKHNALA
jgi:hypothetical protein